MKNYSRLSIANELKIHKFLTQFISHDQYFHPSDYDLIEVGDVVQSFTNDYEIGKTYKVIDLEYERSAAYHVARDYKVVVQDMDTGKTGRMSEPFLKRNSLGLMVDTTTCAGILGYRPTQWAIEALKLGQGPYNHFWGQDFNKTIKVPVNG